MTNRKKLVLVGTGIKTLSHITPEAKTYIKEASLLLYLVNEPILEEYLQENNKNSHSLAPCYFKHQNRPEAYREVTEHILSKMKDYDFITIVFYGHPTVFASPGLQAIKLAKEIDIETLILPGISAEDCLFADLEIDPGNCGCLSIDASEFLFKKRTLDSHNHVIFWQIAMIGSLNHAIHPDSNTKKLFLQKLWQYYEPDFEGYLYEAAIYPGMSAKITPIKLRDIAHTELSTLATLYLPPKSKALPDNLVLEQLNLKNIANGSIDEYQLYKGNQST